MSSPNASADGPVGTVSHIAERRGHAPMEPVLTIAELAAHLAKNRPPGVVHPLAD